MPAFYLVAMWASFIFGAGAHAIVEHNIPRHDDSNPYIVYRLGIDYGGREVERCEESQ